MSEHWFPPPRPKDRDRRYPLPDDVYDVMDEEIEMNGLEMKYFVLNPNKQDAYGKASREAIGTYAGEIYDENPKLSAALIRWLEEIEARKNYE